MTHLDRVLAALSGGFADRRAWTMVLSLYGARLRGTPPESYYRDPRLYAEGQAAVAERFGPDLLYAPFALTLEAEAFGAELVWPTKAPPNVRKPLSAEKAGRLADVRPEDSRSLSYLVEGLRRVVEGAAGTTPVAGILVAPVDLPALIFGIESWLEILLFDQILADSLLELSVRHFDEMAAACFKAGAAIVATPVMFTNPKIFNASLVERRLLPSLAKAFAGAGGPLIFHHGAIRVENVIERWRDLPGVAGFVVDENDDLARVRDILGPEKVILGGFNGPLMEKRDPERIRGLVRAALESRAGDPRFILASCAADVPWDTPEANIDGVIEEVATSGAVSGAAR